QLAQASAPAPCPLEPGPSPLAKKGDRVVKSATSDPDTRVAGAHAKPESGWHLTEADKKFLRDWVFPQRFIPTAAIDKAPGLRLTGQVFTPEPALVAKTQQPTYTFQTGETVSKIAKDNFNLEGDGI